MLVLASLFDDAGTVVGLLTGAIAIGGFLGHARPALSEKGEREVRSATVSGGLIGLAIGALIALGTFSTR